MSIEQFIEDANYGDRPSIPARFEKYSDDRHRDDQERWTPGGVLVVKNL